MARSMAHQYQTGKIPILLIRTPERLSSRRSCLNSCDGCERYPTVALAIPPNLKEVRTVGIVQVTTSGILLRRQKQMVLTTNKNSLSRTENQGIRRFLLAERLFVWLHLPTKLHAICATSIKRSPRCAPISNKRPQYRERYGSVGILPAHALRPATPECPIAATALATYTSCGSLRR